MTKLRAARSVIVVAVLAVMCSAFLTFATGYVR